ncbi:MAG: hypothetical protein H6581_02880 [Bacteroidia bacterium]|nr:hypothetical protein [Bacteroidia bacterium]
MIQYQDFFPTLEKAGIFTADKIESLQDPLSRMNTWIEDNPGIEVINIETVVLPNIYKKSTSSTSNPSLKTEPSQSDKWYQGFRIWYREGHF